MIILKITKKQGFALSLEDKFFEKPQGGWGGGGGGGGEDKLQITKPLRQSLLSDIYYLAIFPPGMIYHVVIYIMVSYFHFLF